jgi:hypothetical protein
MDLNRMDDDDLFSDEDEETDPIEEMIAHAVRSGELRTVYDPVRRELMFFNPCRVSDAFPLELN